ncbi:MAG: hypothetical protein HKM87_09370 [Ignavibacteriaceae bacterium]|nr:hypothetical protein [Ignavibacteriaceae bacterium]
MNILVRKRVINIVIIFALLSHLTFLHNVLDNYVICFGADGHIAVEKVSDCDECPAIEFSKAIDIAYTEVNIPDCKDISLDQNCFESNQFITKDKVDISDTNLVLNTILLEPKNETKYYCSTNTNKDKNHILENYTTVSLLI